MNIVPLHKRRQPKPARIVLYINGTRRDLLPTDRVVHLARIARTAFKLTGEPARLYASGWDWQPPEEAS